MSSGQALPTVIPANEPSTSTPEVPGMTEGIRTLRSDFWLVAAPTPSFGKRIEQQFKEAIGQVLGDIAMMGGPDIGKIILDAPLIWENLKTVPRVPEALVSAAPLVQKMRIDRVLADLETIPEGKALVDMARATDSRLLLDAALAAHGGKHHHHTNIGEGELAQSPGDITVSAFMPHGSLTHVLTHELQHRRQLLSGVLVPFHEKIPSPMEAIWYNRLIEADAEATTADIAYKLKEAGRPAAWDAMLQAPFTGAAKAYEAAVAKNSGAAEDGTAKRAAFDAWFERASPRGIMPSQIYNAQGLSSFIGLHQLQQMADAGRPFEPLTPDDLKKLGAPDKNGVNYLDLPGHPPLTDPYYRAPNWNARQAGMLAAMQVNYEELKAKQLGTPDLKRKPPTPLEDRVKPALAPPPRRMFGATQPGAPKPPSPR